MAFNIVTAVGILNTLTFSYNEITEKRALYYAGLKRSDGLIDVVNSSIYPETSILYDSGSGWCTATLGATEDNTGKPIIIKCTQNTSTTERRCKVFLKYGSKITTGYLLVKQSPQPQSNNTIRFWNQRSSAINSVGHYMILICQHRGTSKYYGIALDTYGKSIAANSYINVSDSTLSINTSNEFGYYDENNKTKSVKLSGSITLAEAANTMYHNFYITSASIVSNNTLVYTGGNNSTYYIGDSLSSMPMGTRMTEYLPLSITYSAATT